MNIRPYSVGPFMRPLENTLDILSQIDIQSHFATQLLGHEIVSAKHS